MSIGKMKYSVFCSARLQWNGTKLEPFARVRAQGHAEAQCRRLMNENPGAVAVALGPQGYKYTTYDMPEGNDDTFHTISSGGSVVGVGSLTCPTKS